MPQHAFVTGGTGFIGINLVKMLIDKGWQLTVLHRPTSDLTYLKNLPVELRSGSVTDFSTLQKVFPDRTDAVFHLAGDTNLWSAHNERQYDVNVSGTRNMVNVAKEKEVSVFIHTSSASAWGIDSGKEISEDVPQNGNESWVNYEKTKWAGEREALKARAHGIKVVILNPTAVTGPHDKNNWGRLFLALQRDDIPGIPDGIISVNHVNEVARAHINAVEKGRDGERYILGGVDITFSRFIKNIAEVGGVDKIPKPVPTPLLKALAHMHNLISKISGNEPELTPELVKMMTRKNISYSSQKAIDELNYKIVPLEQSVRDCYEWLKKENHL